MFINEAVRLDRCFFYMACLLHSDDQCHQPRCAARAEVGVGGRHAVTVPALGSLIVPFRELQPSLRQLRRIYRGTRAVLMGEEVARDPTRSHRPAAHYHAPHCAECRPHILAGGHPPRRRHLSSVHALAGHWVRDLCTICPGNARLLQEQCGR